MKLDNLNIELYARNRSKWYIIKYESCNYVAESLSGAIIYWLR